MAEQLDKTPQASGKLSLIETAEILERLMGEVEDADKVTEEMTLEIQAIKSLHVDKVDRVIHVFDAASYHMRMLEEEQKILAEKIKRLKDRTETLKEYCMTTMKAFPNQVFKGKTKQLAIQKNGGMAKLMVELPMRTPKMFDRILDEQKIYDDECLISAEEIVEYVKEVIIYVIDSDKLRADLEAGKTFPWAKLERGEHLRIR